MGREADRVAGLLVRAVQNGTKVLALNINEGLIDGTPVDLGWARANWVMSIGRASDDLIGGRDSFDTGQQELGMAEVASRYRLADGPIFITNNVPYIEALNTGSSDQAPAGFIEAVIETEVDKANRRVFR